MTAGHGTSLLALATGFLLIFAVAWSAAGHERGLPTICGWMLRGQAALHLLFSFSDTVSGAAPAGHTMGAGPGAGQGGSGKDRGTRGIWGTRVARTPR